MSGKQYNKEQQEVITAYGGYHLVLAPPGCGKTEVLAERILYAHQQHGVSYSDMLCLTFTNRASRGMADRIREMAANEGDIDQLYVGNIHRFCSKYLFEHAIVPMETSIIDEDDSISIIADIMNEDEFKILRDTKQRHRYSTVVNLQHFMRQYASGHPKDVTLHMDAVDNHSLHHICQRLHLSFTRENIVSVYRHIDEHHKKRELQATPEAAAFLSMLYAAHEYELYKQRHQLLDFEDLLLTTYDVLTSSSDNVPKLYHWIEIDEIQDLSPLQLRIIDLITAREDQTVMYLGDSQQAIFSFMGAELNTLNDLAERCKNNIHNLYINYRSPRYLLDVFNDYASHTLGLNKQLLPTTANNEQPQKGDLTICASRSNIDEYHDVAHLVGDLHQQNPLQKTAIIVSYNNEADEMSACLNQLHLQHFKVSGRDLFSEPAVKLLLAHFNVVQSEHNFIAWSRLFTGLHVINYNAAARDSMRQLINLSLSPTDFLLFNGSSYVLNYIERYEHEEIVIFDTETTGLDIFHDDIIQIAAIKVRNGQMVAGSELNLFLQTTRPIPSKLGQLDNPIVDEYKRQKLLPPAEALQQFMQYADSCILLGHNTDFDYHILDNCLQRHCGISNLKELHPHYLDTLKLARLLEPRLKSHKLKDLLSTFNLTGANSHLANDDIMATKSVADFCYQRAIAVANAQRDYISRHQHLIEKFRQAYQGHFLRARALLFTPVEPGKEPALLQEFNRFYSFLTEQKMVQPLAKMPFLINYLREDVILPQEHTLVEQLNNHLQDLNTFKEADLCGSRSMTERIFVSTVHKAKGLEFDNVILFEATDSNYPGFHSKDDIQKREEEKRRFYVALSRAKRRLILFYSLKRITPWGHDFPNSITSFVHSIQQHFQRRDFF